jgi:hypothetical protein
VTSAAPATTAADFNTTGSTTVEIPDSVLNRGNGTTYTVTSIDSSAFASNKLTSVTFAGPASTVGTGSALGRAAAVKVYYYEKYHADEVGTNGFTTATWYGYSTSALETAFVMTLDLGLNVGASVAVSVEGLLVGSADSVVVRSIPITIASGSATRTGTFSDGSGRMPSGLAAGPRAVTFTGTDSDGNAVSQVAHVTVNDTGTVTCVSYLAAESTVPDETGRDAEAILLAETGFDAAPFAAAALLLLAAGVVLTLRRRRGTA